MYKKRMFNPLGNISNKNDTKSVTIEIEKGKPLDKKKGNFY